MIREAKGSREGNAASSKSDRRKSNRQPLSPEASYVLLTDPDGKPVPGRVRDISPEGIGLLLNCQYEAGTLMSVGLTNKTGLFSRSLVLLATRIVKQPDGTYIVGGAFVTRLRGEELQALLL